MKNFKASIIHFGREILEAIAGLFFLSVAFLLLLATRPDWVINDATLQWLAMLLQSRTGITLQWDDAHFSARSRTLLRKEVSIEFRELCFQEGRNEGCFPKLQFSADIDFSLIPPRLRAIGPATIEARTITIVPDQKKKSADKRRPRREPLPYIEPPKWIAQAELRPILIRVGSAIIQSGTDRIEAQLTARGFTGENRLPQLTFSGQASTQDGAKFKAQGGFQMNPAMHRERAGRRFQLEHSLDFSFEKARQKIELTANGHSGRRFIHSEVSGRLKRVIPNIETFSVSNCQVELSTRQNKLNCPVQASLPIGPIASRTKPRIDIPALVDGLVTADFRSESFPLNPSDEIDGEVAIELLPTRTSLFDAEGEVRSQVRGVIEDFPKHWKLDSELNVSIVVRKFETAVKRLNGSKFAVPAPLRVLKGEVEVTASGKADFLKGNIPVGLRSNLSSSGQTMNLKLNGILEVSKSAKLDLELSNVQLQLPRLNLATPPRLLPDDRFRDFGQPPPKASLGFGHEIRIHTPKDRPARVVSNLAKSPVPVHLDLVLKDDQPIAGTVQLARFPLQLFRRQAVVEHFRLELRSPSEESPIAGLVSVHYPDYVIKVQILGTLGHPRLRLESDPPVAEENLLAVLLFGREINELDPGQTQSVGSAQAALTEGAFNLASLYVLASTPVQSVNYNPTSGLFSVSVRLAEGTLLDIGAGRMETFGIQQRLSPHWSIRTEVQEPTETTARTASAFLEWHYRY